MRKSYIDNVARSVDSKPPPLMSPPLLMELPKKSVRLISCTKRSHLRHFLAGGSSLEYCRSPFKTIDNFVISKYVVYNIKLKNLEHLSKDDNLVDIARDWGLGTGDWGLGEKPFCV
ncbi:MAG: hypothetical protein V7K35_21200 [Nostoc sp.]|uniref:hypothetical protein n=1 Tax=Nostoc sp. TaxID=1180 RepID=UPI002FFAB1A7